MQPLTSEHVQAVLAASGYDVALLTSDDSTATSELAAQAIGCRVGQIAKSICFFVAGEPVLVVASGTNTVDDRKIASRYAVGRKKVKLAKPEQCVEIFGYAPGGVPPIAHRTPDIPILLDMDLQQYERVYAAAGTANINFGITPAQLAALTRGTWLHVAKDS